MLEVFSWALWGLGVALLVSWAHDDDVPRLVRLTRESKMRKLSADRVRNRF